MSEAIQYEVQLFLASLTIGIWLVMIYDGIRLFRFIVRHGTLWTGIEDGLYWIFSGMVTFMLLFRQNDGVLRSYAILGVLAGMLVYNTLISRSVFKLLKKIKKYLTMSKKKQK